MNLPISLIIARRYAQASKDGKFVGLISLFSKAQEVKMINEMTKFLMIETFIAK